MKRKTGIYAGLTNIFVAMLIFAVMAYNLADSYRATLDERLLTSSSKIVNTGPEEDMYDYLSAYSTTDELVTAHEMLNERLQAEGTVLLKNQDHALPLSTEGDIKVTLFGMRSDLTQFCGSIGAMTARVQNVSLEEALNERGFAVNPEMSAFYKGLEKDYKPGSASSASSVVEVQGGTVNEVPQAEYANAPQDSYAAYADAAIIVLGRDCSEARDFYPGETGIANPEEFEEGDNILGLSLDEKALISYVESQGCFDKIIVLINSTSAMEIDGLKNDENIDAIMWIGAPGNYGFYGVADLLNAASGMSPSGSLTDTYAVNTAKSPAAQNFGLYCWENYKDIDASSSFELRAAWYLVCNESIYDGYKYYETRYYDSIVNPDSGAASEIGSSVPGAAWNYDTEVSYPFGYGLTYTSFTEEIVPELSDIQIDGTSTVTVRVTNTGDVAGKDNVQLYLALPYAAGQVEKSAIQLVGYGKTGEAQEAEGFEDVVYLQPGESEDVTITIERDYYASYDTQEGDGAYVLDAGTYYLAVGDGAHDALNHVLSAQGYLDGDASASTLAVELAEKVVIDETKEGQPIQNQFEDCDINTLIPGTATYLTRSDWAGTFPQEINGLTATAEMIPLLKNDTYTMAVGEDTSEYEDVFGTKNQSNGVNVCILKGVTDYEDPAYDEVISNMPLETILYEICMEYSQAELYTEVKAGKLGLSDGPVGLLKPLGINAMGIYEVSKDDPNYDYNLNTYVSPPVVGATFSHKLAYEEGKLIGDDSIWVHNTWLYASAMNNHRCPYNGRNNEYYSEDPILTGYMASDTVIGAQENGVVCTVKHFAFNNMETNREGVATFFDEQAGRENELRGFQIVFEVGKTKSVMTSFNRIGLTFSSADEGLITGLLRGEWDYKGAVGTDMVKAPLYESWEECLMAGTDIMLNTSPINEDGKAWETLQVKYVSQDADMMAAIYESIHHTLYAFGDSIWLNGLSADSEVVRLYPYWEVIIISVVGFAAIGTVVFGLLWILSLIKSRKKVK